VSSSLTPALLEPLVKLGLKLQTIPCPFFFLLTHIYTPLLLGHYRHIGFVDGLVENIRSDPTVETLYDLYMSGKCFFLEKNEPYADG
jgi:hypothetical protein